MDAIAFHDGATNACGVNGVVHVTHRTAECQRMKLCKNRCFAGPPSALPNEWICAHPAAMSRRTTPVTGDLANPQDCSTNRQRGPCGMNANRWEAVDPPPVGFV
jgi:hypothetical protein